MAFSVLSLESQNSLLHFGLILIHILSQKVEFCTPSNLLLTGVPFRESWFSSLPDPYVLTHWKGPVFSQREINWLPQRTQTAS